MSQRSRISHGYNSPGNLLGRGGGRQLQANQFRGHITSSSSTAYLNASEMYRGSLTTSPPLRLRHLHSYRNDEAPTWWVVALP